MANPRKGAAAYMVVVWSNLRRAGYPLTDGMSGLIVYSEFYHGETHMRVECYAGYKGNERPQAFYLGERRLAVDDVIDRWYGPDYCYFKVVADDGNVYILKYNESQDFWQLVFFSDKEANFEVSPDTWKKACQC